MTQMPLPLVVVLPPAAQVARAMASLVECARMGGRLTAAACAAQYMMPDERTERGGRVRPASCVGCAVGRKRAAAAGLLVECACPTCGGSGRVLRDVVPMADAGRSR